MNSIKLKKNKIYSILDENMPESNAPNIPPVVVKISKINLF